MISVIVPIYKVEEYLEQCLISILGQTYGDIELLAIDDGSPDGCGAICDACAAKDGRVRVFHTENRGLSAARNLGLREARGEYIGFVDPDDWVEPDMFDFLLAKAIETGADVCECGFWREYGDSSRETRPDETVYRGKAAFAALIEGEIRSFVWNKLYRRAVFEGVTFPEGRHYEDVLNMCEVLARSECVAAFACPKYHYRRREGSISKTNSARNRIDYACAMVERYRFIAERHPELLEDGKKAALKTVARGSFLVWRSWYSFTPQERRQYLDKAGELSRFSRENVPFFGCAGWPAPLRYASPFLRRTSPLSFAMVYYPFRWLAALRSVVRRIRRSPRAQRGAGAPAQITIRKVDFFLQSHKDAVI